MAEEKFKIFELNGYYSVLAVDSSTSNFGGLEAPMGFLEKTVHDNFEKKHTIKNWQWRFKPVHQVVMFFKHLNRLKISGNDFQNDLQLLKWPYRNSK